MKIVNDGNNLILRNYHVMLCKKTIKCYFLPLTTFCVMKVSFHPFLFCRDFVHMYHFGISLNFFKLETLPSISDKSSDWIDIFLFTYFFPLIKNLQNCTASCHYKKSTLDSHFREISTWILYIGYKGCDIF